MSATFAYQPPEWLRELEVGGERSTDPGSFLRLARKALESDAEVRMTGERAFVTGVNLRFDGGFDVDLMYPDRKRRGGAA